MKTAEFARIHDHAQSVHPNWRRVLDHVRVSETMLTWSKLRSMRLEGLLSADVYALALDLWTFLGTVMTDNFQPRRQALAAGEEDNGFELFRTLYWDHEGGAQHVQLQGVRQFLAFPQSFRAFPHNS